VPFPAAGVAPEAREERGLAALLPTDVYFPRVNGVSTSIATFRAALSALGHATRLVAPAYGAGEREEAGVLRVAGRRVPFDPEDRFVPARRMLETARSAGRCDLVHVQTPFSAHRAGVALARERGLPLVETYHTHFEGYFEHYAPFLPAALARAAARRMARRQGREVDLLVVPSTAMRAVLERYGVTAPIEALPTGLPESAFRPGDRARFRARHGIPEARPVLVHVGRLGHEKNVGFLLDALLRLRTVVPDVLLVLAGEGPAAGALERRIAAEGLGPHVLRLGYLDRDRQLADCYRAGDAFVFASKTETQGLVLLEAMAQGVPVVALAELGTADLLAAGRGALVPREDPADFAAACARLLGDRVLALRLGAEARGLAAAWSARAMAERLARLWSELIERPAARRRPR